MSSQLLAFAPERKVITTGGPPPFQTCVLDAHGLTLFPREWPGTWTPELAQDFAAHRALSGEPLRALVCHREGWLVVDQDVTDTCPPVDA